MCLQAGSLVWPVAVDAFQGRRYAEETSSEGMAVLSAEGLARGTYIRPAMPTSYGN